MAKKRTPPLFEVLSGPDRRSSAAGPGSVLGRREPIQVRLPESQASSADGSTPSSGRKAVQIPIQAVFIGIAVLLALFFGGWAIVYQLGAKQKESDLARFIDTNQPPVPPTVTPLPSPTLTPVDSAVPTILRTTPPAQPAGEPPLADPRKSGVNYLHIDTMTWKDAERAVAYLNQNGIAAAAAPSKPVDPQEARAKNLPHIVFAIDGVPSDQFRASEVKRQALVDKVRRIGKKWQKDDRGSSDFGQPGWVKFK